MTIISTNDNSYTFTTQAVIVDDEKDTASAWASDHIVFNPNYKWIVGNYVEADSANSNGQFWKYDDLVLKGASVNHAPMNIGHDISNIVGAYVASEMVYPASKDDAPFIETLSAFWKFYFPEEYSEVEGAFKEGTLYQSMECVADSLTCVGTDDACGETFDYAGPFGPYCEHIRDRSAFRQFNNPNFTGGGLIIPPDKPGWRKAEIKEVSKMISENASDVLFEQIVEDSPHLDSGQWESLMHLITLQNVSRSDNLADAERAGRLLGVAARATLNS